MKTKDKVLLGISRPKFFQTKYFDLPISQNSKNCFYNALLAYNQIQASFELGIHVDNNIEFQPLKG